MQVLVGGIPAKDESSTDVWQYRSRSVPADVTLVTELDHALERPRVGAPRRSMDCAVSQSSPAAMKSVPKMLTREIVLVLR
jgi:hypothetical protein